jgi:hypothetical protein
MNTFKEIPHPELQLVMAKLFHHAWYDKDRGRVLLELLKEWEKTPCKEVKFLNEINNETELR